MDVRSFVFDVISVVQMILMIAIILAVIAFIVYIIKFVNKADNAAEVARRRSGMVWGLIALTLITGVWALTGTARTMVFGRELGGNYLRGFIPLLPGTNEGNQELEDDYLNATQEAIEEANRQNTVNRAPITLPPTLNRNPTDGGGNNGGGNTLPGGHIYYPVKNEIQYGILITMLNNACNTMERKTQAVINGGTFRAYDSDEYEELQAAIRHYRLFGRHLDGVKILKLSAAEQKRLDEIVLFGEVHVGVAPQENPCILLKKTEIYPYVKELYELLNSGND